MSMSFNADEIFEMAEEIERNGAKFYRTSAKKFPQVSELLLELAAMEDDHLKTFAQMRSELSDSEKEPTVFDPGDEGHLYLQVMADDHVFEVNADPVEKLTDGTSVKDVLKLAIGIEKDSIAFYTGFRGSISAKAGTEKLEAIIKEEFSHLNLLSMKIKDL
ncbi:ferritin family protein [Planctomycetota bacterium]